jgi:soluble lytic murein transglycosylase-like protein
MKKSFLTLSLCLLAATTSLSQGRQRIFDNFDTAKGVNVIKPASYALPQAKNSKAAPSASTVSYATPTGSTKVIGGKRYLMPTNMSAPVGSALKNKKGAPSMNADEGFSSMGSATRSTAQHLAMGVNNGMKGFTTGNPVFDSYIVDSSRRYGIDPLLIYSQMHQESSFKLQATSNKGASGLMQLMPATARRLGVSNIYDPKQNIEGGVKYMRMLLDMFGQNVNLALAGYNAGEGAVMRYGNAIPPFNETREYVRRISARYSSISTPGVAGTMPRLNPKIAAKLIEREAAPLTISQNATAIKLPDGRMRLVN